VDLTSKSGQDPETVTIRVQPHDVVDCEGCGQRLTFDARGFVPPDQLDACRGLCDWTGVERDGVAVPPPTDDYLV
jgi:hypothetical protein